MEPIHYLKIFRRRWWLIAALVLVGVALGLLSDRLTGAGGDGDFYAATHTLILDRERGRTGEPGATPTPDTAANFDLTLYLAKGEVPDLVAEQLGGDPIRLSSRVALTPNPALGTLEVTATGTGSRETEELANTYATTLVEFLASRDRTEREQEVSSLEGRIASLDQQLADLDAQLLAGADPAVVEPEKDLLAEDRALLRRQLTDAREALEAPSGFTTLSEAEAIELGPEEYAAALASIQTDDSDVKSARDAQIEAAQEAASSDGPDGVVRAGVGGVLGLVAGIVLVLVLDRFDTRVRTRQDVEDAFGMPVLAEIPRLTKEQLEPGEVVSWAHPRSRAAEAFRVLRSGILFARAVEAEPTTNGAGSGDHASRPPDDEREGKILLVTSPGPAEGKTTVTANLAAVLAEAGHRVLALNCDYRRPKLHAQFGVPYEPRRVLDTAVPGVSVIADVIDDPTRVNPAEVVAAQREVVEKARDMFDVLLLDTAPLLTTNDATDLLPIVDMVVVVARGNRTTRDAGDRAAELLERRGARVVGAVLVDGEAETPGQYYYYREAYYDDDTPRERVDTAPRSSSPTATGDDVPGPADRLPSSMIGADLPEATDVRTSGETR